jgi:D-threo-aldose 1-dehydrogenase
MNFSQRQVARTSLYLPSLGFGGAPLGGLFDAVDSCDASETLDFALNSGMRYIDTAPFYGFGLSERRVGDSIRDRDYLLSTKVGRLLEPGAAPNPASLGWPTALPFHPGDDYSYDGIMQSFEHSLQRLGVSRIDILYVHDIGEMTHGDENTAHLKTLASSGYKALEELRASKRVKAIGLGVNESKVCLQALEFGQWDVFLLAGRYTLLEQDPLDDLLPACEEHQTSIVIGGPFNSGVLVGNNTWNYSQAPESILQKVDQIRSVCDDFGVELAAAALQFPLAHPVVASVIPGLRNRSELDDTLAWIAQDIPQAFWQRLKDKELLHTHAPVPTVSPFLEIQP